MIRFALITALSLSSGAWALAADISKVNGSVTVAPGQQAGNVSTVNGSIRVGRNAKVAAIKTVNGGITLAEGVAAQKIRAVNGGIDLDTKARAASLENVNGGITLGAGAHIQGPLSSVNGAMVLERTAQVSGDVTNVNGSIRLNAAQVKGRVETVSGNIHIGANSRVDGGILVREQKCNNWFSRCNHRKPVVVIGPNAVVKGELRFEREVELYVSDRASIGPVTGAKVIRFSGERPPGR